MGSLAFSTEPGRLSLFSTLLKNLSVSAEHSCNIPVIDVNGALNFTLGYFPQTFKIKTQLITHLVGVIRQEMLLPAVQHRRDQRGVEVNAIREAANKIQADRGNGDAGNKDMRSDLTWGLTSDRNESPGCLSGRLDEIIELDSDQFVSILLNNRR